MAKDTILFLHGFSSSAQSTKAQYFREKFGALPHVDFCAMDLNPTPKDFEYMTTTGLIDRVRQYVLDHSLGEFSIIGSSYGGLISLHYAHRFGGVKKMLLLAPGLRWLHGGLAEEELAQWKEAGALPFLHYAFEKEIPVRYDLQVDGIRYLEFISPPAPILIIHGCNDTTVPTDHSRRYAAEFPDRVHLIEVDSDHDLNGHLPFIWEHVGSTLLSD